MFQRVDCCHVHFFFVRLFETNIIFVYFVTFLPLHHAGKADIWSFHFRMVKVETLDIHFFRHFHLSCSKTVYSKSYTKMERSESIAFESFVLCVKLFSVP